MPARLEWSVNLNPLRLSSCFDPEEMEHRGKVALAHLRELGVSRVRMDLLMGWLLPAPREVNAGAVAWYRSFIRQLADIGIQVFAVLYNPAPWACELGEADSASFLGVWRDYCRLIAREFPELHLFQVWNEPNNYLSHLKGDFNFFRRKRIAIGQWAVRIPTGVDWQTLGSVFRIAREELPDQSVLVYNALATLSNFSPLALPHWTEWEHFTDRLLEEAGEAVDAIAIDHYPETWTPGVGPLEWAPLDLLLARVNDPRSPWYRKTALVGEVGYSSCRNVDLLHHRLPWKFFPRDHTQETMAAWYAASLPYLAAQLRPERLPHNRVHMINVYELFDGPVAFAGDRADRKDLVGIEHHFGLLDAKLEPKRAYGIFREIVGGRHDHKTAPLRNPPHPVGLYLQGSRASKALTKAISPSMRSAMRTMRPALRRRDWGYFSAGALFVLYQMWRASGSTGSKG